MAKEVEVRELKAWRSVLQRLQGTTKAGGLIRSGVMLNRVQNRLFHVFC